MIEIPLTQGKIAIIDDEDYEKVSKYKWQALNHYYTYYAMVSTDKKNMYMHRFIMNPKVSQHIDHINGNGLDNRRCNLRLANKQINAYNSKKRETYKGVVSTSKYRGVSKEGNRWRCRIRIDNKDIYLGRFDTEEEAARTYDKIAKLYIGEVVRLNFPIN